MLLKKINQEDKEKIVQLVNEFSDSIDEIQAITVSANTDYIFSRNEVKPFGDDNIKWVKVNIREICAVKDLWKYCNNPFVIKGCREYKHLLWAEMIKITGWVCLVNMTHLIN